MRRILSLGFVLILAIVAFIFSALNLGTITINVYFTSLTMPIPVLVFSLLFAGVLLGGIVSSWLWMRKASELRKLKRRLQEREKELDSLRNLPLKDSM